MQIRRADIADEQALQAIRRRSIRGLAVPTLSVEQAEAWAMGAAPDRIARAIQEHEVWVAVEQVPIGWVEIDRDRVAALYVEPRFARQGVGAKLLSLAETAIQNAGYAIVRLEASPNALGFYLRSGYVRAGPQAPDDSYLLTKNLADLAQHDRMNVEQRAGVLIRQ